MFDELQTIDVYKCLISLAAGALLGLERELKDKAAGLKTISVICLGATLFTILSMRFSPERATALSAYIVSGVGFLGAGVIFKDGVNISGLTTASILWLETAVGTSIGFGEFYLAGIFLLGGFIIIWITPFLNKIVASKKQNKELQIVIARDVYESRDEVVKEIKNLSLKMSLIKTSLQEDRIELTYDIVIEKGTGHKLSDFLLHHPAVKSFTL